MSFGMFPVKDTMTVERKKEMLRKACENGGWRQLKQDIIKYNEMCGQVMNDTENHRDPLFRRYVKMYKTKLGAADFLKNRLQIYGICNQRAMQERLSVDEMMNMLSDDQPEAEATNSSDDNGDQQDSN